jgi:hypothetical protein
MAPDIRDTLFGDMPLEAWPASAQGDLGEPWVLFVRAREALAAGRTEESIALWRRITMLPHLESRHYLQAWHFLRTHGADPADDVAKTLLGVVVEVHLKEGLDLLAAYADHHARYFNFSGAGVIWEHANDSLDRYIDALLAAGAQVLRAIGPWTGPRRPPPPVGQTRLNFLSPGGLHFGQASMAVLGADHLAGPTINAATGLMQQLVARGSGSRT